MHNLKSKMSGCVSCMKRYGAFAGRSLGYAVIYAGVSIVVGLALLEIPFSLAFDVTAAIAMILLGAGTIFRVFRGWPCVPSTNPPDPGKDQKARSCTNTWNIILAGFLATLALLAGVFTLWIYFQSSMLPPMARLSMFIVLGASLNVIITHNLLVIIQDIIDVCSEPPVTTKGGLQQAKPGNPVNRTAAAIESRNKQYVIQFISYLATGLYYGFMYGQLAAQQIATVTNTQKFNPWGPVSSYLIFSVPVAATTGFLTGLLVAYMSQELVGVPLPPSANAAPAKGGLTSGSTTGAAAPTLAAVAKPAAAQAQAQAQTQRRKAAN